MPLQLEPFKLEDGESVRNDFANWVITDGGDIPVAYLRDKADANMFMWIKASGCRNIMELAVHLLRQIEEKETTHGLNPIKDEFASMEDADKIFKAPDGKVLPLP